jgi:hypothetical protein
MGHDKIIKVCSKGKYFDTLVRSFAMAAYGSQFFVDRNTPGVDTQDGESWDTPLLTLTKAVEKCTANKGDVIFWRGRVTTGQQLLTQQIINKNGIHLFGMGWLFGKGGGYNSCFVSPQTALGSDNFAATICEKGGLELFAHGIEVAGLKFYAPDVAQLQGHIVSGKDTGSPFQGISIHDNDFQGDVNGSGEQSGVFLESQEGLYFGFNNLYYTEYGVCLRSGGSDYSTGALIEENVFRGNKYGLRIAVDACLNLIRKNRHLVEGALGRGWAMTQGVLVDIGGNDNDFEDLEIYHATKNTAITNNGTANVFRRCYYDVTSGAGTLFT